MEEEIIEDFTESAPVEEAGEGSTVVAVTAESFELRMGNIENLLVVNLIGLALIAGAVIACMIMRFFHVR